MLKRTKINKKRLGKLCLKLDIFKSGTKNTILRNLFQISVIFVYAGQVRALANRWKRRHPLRRLYAFCRSWFPSHCFGSLLLALPIAATFANFECRPTFYHGREREFFLQVKCNNEKLFFYT